MARQRMIWILLMGLLSNGLWAADLIREQRMAAEIEDAILVGSPVRLQDGDHQFLAIHAESELEQVHGAVIVIHGRGAHPDWTDVVNPVRSELAAMGWETLSLQMPVAEAGAGGEVYQSLIPESYPRIAAGIAFIKQRGVEDIAIVAHSLGARMAVSYLGANPDIPELKALVAVSLPIRSSVPRDPVLDALANIKIPVLDIYGSRDIDSVLKSIRKRSAVGRKASDSRYTQVVTEGADHFFAGLESSLVSRINGWLRKVVAAAMQAQ